MLRSHRLRDHRRHHGAQIQLEIQGVGLAQGVAVGVRQGRRHGERVTAAQQRGLEADDHLVLVGSIVDADVAQADGGDVADEVGAGELDCTQGGRVDFFPGVELDGELLGGALEHGALAERVARVGNDRQHLRRGNQGAIAIEGRLQGRSRADAQQHTFLEAFDPQWAGGEGRLLCATLTAARTEQLCCQTAAEWIITSHRRISLFCKRSLNRYRR